MPKDFSIYSGKWPCKTCHEVVLTLRLWPESGDVTWMCSNKIRVKKTWCQTT
jgi:hypothetical protein